jgi:hypothetical protein
MFNSTTFTLIQVVLSLVGIFVGLVVAGGSWLESDSMAGSVSFW